MATDKVAYWLDIAEYDLDTARQCTRLGDDYTLLSCAISALKRR